MSKDNPVDRDSVANMLARTSVVLDGHFVLTSGLHSPRYLEKFRLLQYPEYTAACAGWWPNTSRGREWR